jgi:flavin reductase (DIM6/NTAB) family NADH-FMN oxidoreductase RutF
MKPERFAEVLRRFPLVVSVVTVGRGGAENGLTVSWASPVSFDPPHFMFAVDRLHYSVDFLKSTRNFCVNVLRAGQERLARHFSRQSMSGESKLERVETRESSTGAAILVDALAYFDCELDAVHAAGDHLLVVGRVVDAAALAEGEPLLTTATLRYVKAVAAAG